MAPAGGGNRRPAGASRQEEKQDYIVTVKLGTAEEPRQVPWLS